MKSKKNKIVYLVSTGLLSAMMLFSAFMYFFKYQEVADTFEKLGYPAYLVIPLAIAKLLGVVAIWLRKSKILMEWAYTGFFFNFLLAASAHMKINDGEYGAALVALALLVVSYLFQRKQ